MLNKIKKYIKKILSIISSIYILKDIRNFNITNDNRFNIKLINLMPMLKDRTIKTKFDLHYIYHPAWAARVISKINPKKHVDISSSLHFSTMLSAFIPTEFYDYRPADIELYNLKCKKADLNNLEFADNSIESISCMHTIEHIGLGRYGDKIDSMGDIKAIEELKRVTMKNGHIIFVTPIGKPRLIFNAHRIYSYEQIISYFNGFEIKEFSLISENEGKLIKNADPNIVKKEMYGCGCFWFIKK